MEIKKFIIENYRALEYVEVDLNHSMNPIIGTNESGKTSILNALLAFDKRRDKYNGSEHFKNHSNTYITRNDQTSEICAQFTLSRDEEDNLVKSIKVKTDSEDYANLNVFLLEYPFIELRRQLPSGDYFVEIRNVSPGVCSKIAKHLSSIMPYVLYFDDFKDRVPDEIAFPESYIKTGKIIRNRNHDWQEIVQEVFRRANQEALNEADEPLKTYLSVTERDTRADILSDVQDILNREITKEWHKIKNLGNSLADDKTDLSIVVKEENSTFRFKVIDKSANRSRTFNISNRSKGFQWFFNYMCKLKFNPIYKDKLENCLFLLDEPGSYLHSTAQTGLLEELKRVSKNNTIIYCTHSQYLLNPETVAVGSIKIAAKDSGKVTLTNYGQFKGSKHRGALSPVYDALGLNFNHTFVGRLAIVEGVSDFFLFSMLQKNSSLINADVTFIPGAGAEQLTTLISFALSHADDFVVLLDNDTAGKKGHEKYSKDFGDAVSKKIHIYQEHETKWQLEDFLCKEDMRRLLSVTGMSDRKRALSFLFYEYKNEQSDFFDALSEQTKSNLSSIIEVINQVGQRKQIHQ